jgi:hypothetical protein
MQQVECRNFTTLSGMKMHPLTVAGAVASTLVISSCLSLHAFTPDRETQIVVPSLTWYAQLGTDVAVSGDTAVVGAPGVEKNGSVIGAAYVFARQGAGWVQQAELTAADAAAGSEFGYSVAISGDTVVIGAYGDSAMGDAAGAAYVFVRAGGIWTQQAKLTPRDARTAQRFGDPVAIDGDRIVVGAFADDEFAPAAGAAYVFMRTGSAWIEESKLTALEPGMGDLFGFAVALRGNTIAVGAPFRTVDANGCAGAAYVFEYGMGGWSQTAAMAASDPAPDSLLGWSVELMNDAMVAGAPRGRQGQDPTGVVYLFGRGPGGWQEQGRLVALDAAPNDWFGYDLAGTEDEIAVGASQDSSFGPSSGALYLFRNAGGIWVQQSQFVGTAVAPWDQFGFSVAFDGQSLAAGAPFNSTPALPLIGTAYVFTQAAAPPVNNPPVADASATATEAIAGVNGIAQVTLDGSRSSDPENDPLRFVWTEGTEVLGESARVTVPLAVGIHQVTLAVSDGEAVATTTLMIEVISPATVLRRLVHDLPTLDLPRGQQAVLRGMLSSAIRALDRGRPAQGLHHLSVARKYLAVQSGRHISAATAGRLIGEIDTLVTALRS